MLPRVALPGIEGCIEGEVKVGREEDAKYRKVMKAGSNGLTQCFEASARLIGPPQRHPLLVARYRRRTLRHA